jgi:hypothetical protein
LGIFRSSRTDRPIFNKKGVCKIAGKSKDGGDCVFELRKSTWEKHILRERTRWYLKGQFNKVVETLANPDYILQSPKEQNVASYVKRYDDLHILNTIMARAYLYVLVNLNNNNIRTVYSNPGLKEWVGLWRKK